MNNNDDIVIDVDRLSKEYRFGSIGYGSLYKDLQSWWAKHRGKDDPNAIIGSSSTTQSGSDSFLALNDISFQVRQGDIVGIIGRNGAGKSTLLKILSRITTPTSGEVKIKGRVVSLLEVGTGFHGEMTGRENVFLNGAILGMTKKEIRSKFDEIVAFSEIEQFIDTPVKRYSSGMSVRLAFSVAAHLEPEILLVDEVLAVGDLSFRRKCIGKMQEISSSSNRTIVFVSHDMASIQNICKTGFLLDEGRIIFSGDVRDVVKEYLRINDKTDAHQLCWSRKNKVLPFHDVVRVNSYSVIENQSREISGDRLFSEHSYTIAIEGELVQADSRIIFAVAFYSETQELLFVSDIHDSGEHDFGRMKSGGITLSLEMPQHLFPSGVFEIELLCALHHAGWVLPPNNASRLHFEYFKQDDANPYASENRLGFLAPVLPWRLHS
jgi:lipopolysaccharide transport system ATP-binding protein